MAGVNAVLQTCKHSLGGRHDKPASTNGVASWKASLQAQPKGIRDSLVEDWKTATPIKVTPSLAQTNAYKGQYLVVSVLSLRQNTPSYRVWF